jgi:hypothetical protein
MRKRRAADISRAASFERRSRRKKSNQHVGRNGHQFESDDKAARHRFPPPCTSSRLRRAAAENSIRRGVRLRCRDNAPRPGWKSRFRSETDTRNRWQTIDQKRVIKTIRAPGRQSRLNLPYTQSRERHAGKGPHGIEPFPCRGNHQVDQQIPSAKMVSSTIGNINRYSTGEMPSTQLLTFASRTLELVSEIAFGWGTASGSAP